MIRAWRLCRARYGSDPLSGEGSRLYGGRWNHKGTRQAYLAGSLSLACMEALVHLDLSDLPTDCMSVAMDIPDDVSMKILTPRDLPADWGQVPGPESLKLLGSNWARAMSEAVLVVPSAVIPGESNFLVNPLHPDSRTFVVQPASVFLFDRRLAVHRPTRP